MAEARVVNPLVEQFRQGRVPRDLRLMAAQGALPLGPIDLADLLEFLLHDVDEEIRECASASLLTIAADVMLALARDRSSLPGLLAWILIHREERDVQEAVLQNTTLPDEAIEARASTLPEELAELVVINQVRLLRRTSLLEALEQNQNLSKDQRRRLRELRESFHIGGRGAAAARQRRGGGRPLPRRRGTAGQREGQRRAAALPPEHRPEDDLRPEGHP
jgi:hypothetical protein